MTKIPFLLSLALFTLTLLPAAAAEKFECPNPFKPNTPAKLEQIKGLLPNVNTMANIGQLTVAISTLRREGMSKSLIIDHLIGAYCPMVARRRFGYRCGKSYACSALLRSGHKAGL